MNTDPAAGREGAAAYGAGSIHAGDLPLGGGLLALLRPALDLVQPGGVVAVLSSAPSVRQDLPAWCRIEKHAYLGFEILPGSIDVHRVERRVGGPAPAPPFGAPLPLRDGTRLTSADVLAAWPLPERASPASGFAPRDARVEPGGPVYPFSLLERDHVTAPEVGRLYDQAVAAQWDASRDIPWNRVRELSLPLEAAVSQVMTFLAENELSALYVPARFLPRIHPAYAETAMFLATVLADEARHIDVFLKRARIRGAACGVSSVTTSQSLLSLLELEDFTEAAFLLSVLGEGTFLDLLDFVQTYAPDEATSELARRARADEARHVHFGIAHVRHALEHEPALEARLEKAVRGRATRLAGLGVPAPVQDALTIYAAGGIAPAAVARGHAAFRDLLGVMHEGRVKRLRSAGFSAERAGVLSDLHTSNFM